MESKTSGMTMPKLKYSSWKEASPSKKSIYVMLAVIVMLIILVPTIWWQNTQKAALRMNASAAEDFPDTNATDVMFIDVKLTSINTNEYTYTLLLKLRPTGSLVQNKEGLEIFTAPLTLFVKGQAFEFPASRPITSIEFGTTFASGTSNNYPFDTYFDDLEVTTLRQINSTFGVLIPTKMHYFGTFKSYDATWASERVRSKTVFRISVMRSGTTAFFSVSIILFMWALSLTILTLAVRIWVCKRIVEPPTVAVAAGLLFAIPQFRSVQPGIPPIGCAADTLGFFWNMALIAVALLLLMWNYIINRKESCTNESPTSIVNYQRSTVLGISKL